MSKHIYYAAVFVESTSHAMPFSTLDPFISFSAIVMQIKIDVQAGSDFWLTPLHYPHLNSPFQAVPCPTFNGKFNLFFPDIVANVILHAIAIMFSSFFSANIIHLK